MNSGSSEQLEYIEPVAPAAGAVDSQDGSELVMLPKSRVAKLTGGQITGDRPDAASGGYKAFVI